MGVDPASLNLDAAQLDNARGIIAAVRARGWPARTAQIATEGAIAEAGLRVVASANVPASLAYPHQLLPWGDGLGHDHASCGMFQQQTGYAWVPAGYGWDMNQTTMNSPDGWGPPSVLMNPERSTSLFLAALSTKDWQHMSNWAAAQAVQGSAYSDGSNYRAVDAWAGQIVAALWAETQQSKEDVMIVIIAKNHGIAEKVPGGRYTYTGKEWKGIQELMRVSPPGTVVYKPVSDATWLSMAEKHGRL